MSTTDTDAPDVPVEGEESSEPITLESALDAVKDGSRFAEGVEPATLAERITASATLLRGSVVRATQHYRDAAKSITAARRVTLKADGSPDWAGTSDSMGALMTVAYDAIMAALHVPGNDPKADKKLRSNVRAAVWQMINRTYLELEIRDYVANAPVLDGEDAVMYPDGPDDKDATFLARVREQYVKARDAKGEGPKIPSKYLSAEEREALSSGNGAGPGQGPIDVPTALKYVQRLNALTPQYHARGALLGVSDLVKRVTDPATGGNAIENRESVRTDLERVSTLALFGLKYLDGKTTEKDIEQVAPLFWGESDAPAEVPAS